MAKNDDILWAAVGAGFGAWTFFRGFRVLRNKRLVENLPTSKCRSLAMGLVELEGKAVGSETFPSLIGGIACFCSMVKVERYKRSGKSSRWVTVHEEERILPFFLEDETGRVRVNPHGAEFDLTPDVEYETETGLITWLKRTFSDAGDGLAGPPMQERFRSYCARRGVTFQEPMRFTERNLCPDGPVYVLGMAAEAPGEQDENLRVVIRKGEHHPWFFIAESGQKEVLEKLGRNTWLYIFGGAALSLACVAWLVFRLGLG